MIDFNKEYFGNNCYFYLKDRGDSFTVYYNVGETISESRKSDSKKTFEKKELPIIKRKINTALKSKKKKSKKELDELISTDGTFNNSKIPILNKGLHPRKTTDQTVPMARVSNDPVTRGYRVYWGESKDEKGDVVNEVDYSDAFGYEETKDKDFKDTVKTLKKMGVENPKERANEFGKLKQEKKKGKALKQRLTEKEKIDETKEKIKKIIEDILSKKGNKDSEIISKDDSVNPFITKSLNKIKKMAEKDGISINRLVQILKKGE
jgi:hypothetical protein